MRFYRDRGRLRRTATLAIAAVAMSGAAALAAAPSQAAVACAVDYRASQWPGGMSVNIVVTNKGDAWSSWTLGFTSSGGQKVSQGWSATWSQSGQNDRREHAVERSLTNGNSAYIGFNGT